MEIVYEDDYLAHYGILGQKWGVRRYQNVDGTLTVAGKQRYGKAEARVAAQYNPNSSFFRRNEYADRSRLANKRLAKAEVKLDNAVRKGISKDSDAYRELKAEINTKRNIANYQDYVRKKMQAVETKNIKDGSYWHNRRVNKGKNIAKYLLTLTAMSVPLAASTYATTGAAYVLAPNPVVGGLILSSSNSLTSQQKRNVEREAIDKYKNKLTKSLPRR